MGEVQCPTCDWAFEVAEAPEWRPRKCPSCGERLLVRGTEVQLVPAPAPPSPLSQADDRELTFVEHTIPAGNPAALWSYYLGLFAVIPCLGIALSLLALDQGKKGLDFANQHPEKLGKMHSIVGIFFGVFWLATYVVILVLMCVSR